MFAVSEYDRDILAGLSFYLGRALPAGLTETAVEHGLLLGSWFYPATLDAPAHKRRLAVEDLSQLGRSLRQRATTAGIHMLVRGDLGWPAGTGFDQLPCLWVRGSTDVARLLNKAIAVTGSRACTEYGAAWVRQAATELAADGWTLVANVGYGIDTNAVAAALEAVDPGPILLSAAGLDHRHADPLAAVVEQVAKRGAVISAFPPGCDPIRPRFQLRQRLLGTIAAATVLVEAARDSSALETVRAAAAEGRAACAVLGPVGAASSAGGLQLIAEGSAHPVATAGEVLTAIRTTAGSAGEDLFMIRATARWGLAGYRLTRHIPLFHVPAQSHAHAANTAFDWLIRGHGGPCELFTGIQDPRGAYEAITITITG